MLLDEAYKWLFFWLFYAGSNVYLWTTILHVYVSYFIMSFIFVLDILIESNDSVVDKLNF